MLENMYFLFSCGHATMVKLVISLGTLWLLPWWIFIEELQEFHNTDPDYISKTGWCMIWRGIWMWYVPIVLLSLAFSAHRKGRCYWIICCYWLYGHYTEQSPGTRTSNKNKYLHWFIFSFLNTILDNNEHFIIPLVWTLWMFTAFSSSTSEAQFDSLPVPVNEYPLDITGIQQCQ